MAASKPFAFVCGADEFLVQRAGQQRFAALASETGADEFSREIISGFAANISEVESAINRFREAVQTVPMFGGGRVVWLKDVSFLADNVTGRAEGTLKLVEDLQQLLAAVNPAEAAVLITAAPVDRRRAFPKWCEKNADFALIGGDSDAGGEALAGIVLAEARSLGVTFAPGAIELLLAKVGANTRLLVEEVHKLATYAGLPADLSAKASAVSTGSRPRVSRGATAEASAKADDPSTPLGTGSAVIEESHVIELTPNTAEGDFFEAAEAFFSGDLKWALAALHRHFFAGGDARPVISALQNRNRILLQLRALLDAGEVHLGPRGVDGLPRAATAHAAKFSEAAGEKSSYNIFTQNPWYLGKLASGKLPSLRRLIDNQHELIAAFEEIIRRPGEQEEVLRAMAVRCLT
ncbi:MAG TPA: DNA polymerase III subunit delta [Opitutaceae bacterium]|jgi:DNA polymerase-3 subunit delta|nr:DNA polymerase III subunit delta [Opitutaceae bacterium]